VVTLVPGWVPDSAGAAVPHRHQDLHTAAASPLAGEELAAVSRVTNLLLGPL